MLDWRLIGFFAPDDDAGGGAGVFATAVSVGAAGAFDSGIFFGAAGFSGGGGSALIASGAVRQCVPERDSAVSLGPCVDAPIVVRMMRVPISLTGSLTPGRYG